jgi:hypothetical protein
MAIETVGTPADIGMFSTWMGSGLGGSPVTLTGGYAYSANVPVAVIVPPANVNFGFRIGDLSTLGGGHLPNDYYLTAPGFRRSVPRLHGLVDNALLHLAASNDTPTATVASRFADLGRVESRKDPKTDRSVEAAADAYTLSGVYYAIACQYQLAQINFRTAAELLLDADRGLVRRAVTLETGRAVNPDSEEVIRTSDIAEAWLAAAREIEDSDRGQRAKTMPYEQPQIHHAANLALSRAIYYAGIAPETDHRLIAEAYERLSRYGDPLDVANDQGHTKRVLEWQNLWRAAYHVLSMPIDQYDQARHGRILSWVARDIQEGGSAGGKKVVAMLERLASGRG